MQVGADTRAVSPWQRNKGTLSTCECFYWMSLTFQHTDWLFWVPEIAKLPPLFLMQRFTWLLKVKLTHLSKDLTFWEATVHKEWGITISNPHFPCGNERLPVQRRIGIRSAIAQRPSAVWRKYTLTGSSHYIMRYTRVVWSPPPWLPYSKVFLRPHRISMEIFVFQDSDKDRGASNCLCEIPPGRSI